MYIKVMTDYGCPPLWWDEGAREVGPIDPASLGISDELQADFWKWAAQFDAILNHEDPANSRFSSEAVEQKFEETGRALSKRLAEELGPKVTVRYWKD